MGRAIAVRTDYRSGDIRRIAQRVKNAAQARRLLAIATVLDGAARQEAAKIGGMDRQTLRDWVIRFNEQRPDGLINKVSPGAPGKLTNEHKGTSNNVRGHKFGLGPVFDCLPGFFFRPLLRLEHCRRLHRLHAAASRSSVTRRRML